MTNSQQTASLQQINTTSCMARWLDGITVRTVDLWS